MSNVVDFARYKAERADQGERQMTLFDDGQLTPEPSNRVLSTRQIAHRARMLAHFAAHSGDQAQQQKRAATAGCSLQA